MKAIDISVYQGRPGRDWWQRLVRDGWELAIVGSWHGAAANPHAERNLLDGRAAGLRIATYVVLNARSGSDAVRRGKRACGDAWQHLSFVAIDCEIDGITQRTIRDAVAEVEREGLRPVIYTARWWWYGRFGDLRSFRHLPLWTADYDRKAVLELSPAYGGWTRAALIGKQYDGATPGRRPALYGVEVDKNIFDDSFVKEGDVAAIEELRAELKQTRTDLEKVITAMGKEIVRRDDNLRNAIETGIADLEARVTALERS